MRDAKGVRAGSSGLALIEGFGADVLEVKPRVQVLVHLTDERYVVAAHHIEAQDDLLHATMGGVDAFVALVHDQVHRLVKPLQCANNVPPIGGDDGDEMVDVALEGVGHGCGEEQEEEEARLVVLGL